MDTNKKINMVDREEILAKVEELMLKGIFQPSRIAKEVECAVPTATEYMKAIRKRWELANKDVMFEIQSEGMEKSRRLEEGYWEAFDDADNSSARVGALNGILEVHKFQAFISGWDTTIRNKK